MDLALAILLNILTALALLVGLLFMFTGGMGVARLPDFYSRSHAASKSVTLGILGLLLALVLYIAAGTQTPVDARQAEMAHEAAVEATGDAPIATATTKALLVLVFIIISAPVGSHMLARAAHIAGVRTWSKTLSDELAEDRAAEFGHSEVLSDPPPESTDAGGTSPEAGAPSR